VIAITRYRVPADEAEVFAGQARAVLEAFSACRGHRSGRLGRAADDPELWVMCTEWEGAGFYRRALGEVRMLVIPMSAGAVDEPGAFEIIA
jgi:heme-degrading monooxygenase HmoA